MSEYLEIWREINTMQYLYSYCILRSRIRRDPTVARLDLSGAIESTPVPAHVIRVSNLLIVQVRGGNLIRLPCRIHLYDRAVEI